MLALTLVLAALQQPAPSPLPAVPPLPPQVSDTSPFRRLALPAPDEMREGSGRPGPRYWQQRADYTIRATLDTATHTIAGSETLRYANNSPDTRFAGRGFEGGYTIDYVRAVRRVGQAAGRIPLGTTDNGTMLRVDLDRPLAPGGRAELELAYRLEVPEHGSDRMG